MNELTEGMIVAVRKLDSNSFETGTVKKVHGKLVVVVNRNNNQIRLSKEVLESFYDVRLID